MKPLSTFGYLSNPSNMNNLFLQLKPTWINSFSWQTSLLVGTQNFSSLAKIQALLLLPRLRGLLPFHGKDNHPDQNTPSLYPLIKPSPLYTFQLILQFQPYSFSLHY